MVDGKQIYLRLLRHVVPYWRVFALGIIAMMVLAGTQPALAALLKPAFDGSFVHRDLDTVADMSMLLVVLFAVRGVSSYLSAMAMAVVSSRVIQDMRDAMFAKLMALPNTTLNLLTPGTLLSKITYDATQLGDACTRVVRTLVEDTVVVLGLLGVMFYANWKLTLSVLLIAPVIIVMVRYFTKRLRALSFEMQRLMGRLTHVVQESLEGQKVVRSFGAQAHEQQRFVAIANRVRQFEVKFKSAASIAAPIAHFITSIGLASMMYLAAVEAAADSMTVGTFASFFAAMGLIFSPIKRLTGINAQLQRGIAAASSVFALVDENSERETGTATVLRATGHLEFDAVSFSYAEGERSAIENLCLSVAPGERVALVGPSGSGKSTTANLIPRFFQPDTGRILLDGADINTLTLASLREQIALVSQEVMLFEGTVRDNIAYGPLQDKGDQALWAAIDAAHAREFIDELPAGLDTQVGQHGVRLSGGQRQRLAIARAFLKDAPILILDEATSALDNRSEREIKRALHNLSHGRTTIIIAHRLSSIENADRIVVLEGGRILDQGKHDELLGRSALYSSLYQIQFDRTDGKAVHATTAE
ncbi:MAG: subfamily B ATP-binding cassette protein MsbA [Gammaproteobacteria bacterium]|jgi:subfamily B ATP-binding cassette protein MsbA